MFTFRPVIIKIEETRAIIRCVLFPALTMSLPSPYIFANPHAAAIHVFFQRDNLPDDTLLIKPSPYSMGFMVKYTQNSNATRVEHELANTELVPYLERLFTAMMFDKVPCAFIQIDCPGYSSVVLEMTTILSYLPILRSQIESFQNSWPLECIGKLESCTCSTSKHSSENTQVNYRVTCSSTTGERHVEVVPAVASTTQTTGRVTRSSTRAAMRTH